MRLDKFIANNSVYSRAIARRLIKQGRVHVNGVPASKGEQKIALGADLVVIDEAALAAIDPIYIMLNKPLDAVCASEDSESLTVMDLLCPENFLSATNKTPRANTPEDAAWWYDWKALDLGLHTAGRLDKDSTGLLLISDDGSWTHRITSPNNGCPKTYAVTLADDLKTENIEAFANGILLKNEESACKPASLEIIANRHARVTINEGRYHQVRRMFAAIGNHVTALKRESIGELSLDPALDSGQFRLLNPCEVALFGNPKHDTP